jgi:hypothetical protein
LEKQFKELLRMDPQAILQSSAPEFLKIAALEQVNKASQAPAQQPQGTVADKVVQQSMSPPGGMGPASVLPTPAQAGPVPPGATPQLPPQMPPQMTAIDRGIGGLPADMTMASGGIVSFAEGGRGAEARKKVEERAEETKQFLRGTGELGPSFMDWIEFGLMNQIPELGMANPTSELGMMNPTPEERKADVLGLNAPEMTSADMYYATPEAFRYRKDLPVNKPPTPPTIEDLASRFGIGVEVGGKASGLGAVPTVPDVSSFFPERAKYELKDKFDYAKEREKAIKGIGGLPDFFGSQRKAIEEQAKELQGMQRMGNAEALVSAGQSIANAYDPYGRPQTLIGALTEGLGAYTQSKQASNKEVRAEQRALRALESKLAEAEYAEKRGDVDAAVKARADAATLATELGIKDTDAENLYNITKAKELSASARTQAELGAANQRAAMSSAAKDRRAMFKAAQKLGPGSSAKDFASAVQARYELLFESQFQKAYDAAKTAAGNEGRVIGAEEDRALRSDISKYFYDMAKQQVLSDFNSGSGMGFSQQLISE